MPQIPTELLSLLGSSCIGGIFRLWASSKELQHMERLAMLQSIDKANENLVKPGRLRKEPSSFQITRQLIALMAVFMGIVFPKLVAVFKPQTPIFIGYTQNVPGFLFFNAYEKLNWAKLEGLALTPLDTHLLAAIIGLYFGTSLFAPR